MSGDRVQWETRRVARPAILTRIEESWLALPANVRGVLWVTLGTLAFAVNDIVVKKLGRTFHPTELALFRYGLGFLILSPVFIGMGVEGLKTPVLRWHLLRLALAGTAQLGVYIGVINLLLADATAIAFSRPLFTTLIAVIALGEAVNMRRWAATIVGFAGVVIMVRPGEQGLDPVALIAVGAALVFAVANILIRVLARTEPANRILFYYHLGGTLMFAGPAIYYWRTPAGVEWLLLGAIAMLTTVGMIGFVRGFHVGEASIVGPMEYTRLIYAGLFGYFIFAEVPSYWTFVGAAIIVAATLYIAQVEARRGGRVGPSGG
jgi:drug/metabolite transporter (DMT)-like permease